MSAEEKFEEVAQAVLKAANEDKSTILARWDALEKHGIATDEGNRAYLIWALGHRSPFVRESAKMTLNIISGE